MAQFEEIGKKFVEHYYSMFDANKRADLGGLYVSVLISFIHASVVDSCQNVLQLFCDLFSHFLLLFSHAYLFVASRKYAYF